MVSEALMEMVDATIRERLGALDARERARDAREAMVRRKMADIPAIYQNLLPNTDDPAILEAAANKIREQFQSAFPHAPRQAPQAGGASAGSPPPQTVDLTKMSAAQLISLGLRNNRQQALQQRQQDAQQRQQAAPPAASGQASARTAANAGGIAPPGGQVDMTKMNGGQLIAAGLALSKPSFPPPAGYGAGRGRRETAQEILLGLRM